MKVARSTYDTGVKAEAAAATFLTGQGMELLEQRCRTPYGEIDLVMRDGQALVFVEVKARTTQEEALLSIRPRQQQRIMEAALHYVSTLGDMQQDMRFDVIAISRDGQIQHLAHAWDGSCLSCG